jgi:predicted RNA binding protein YcfA (HicA-like mRNA interferase family)
VSRKDKLTRRLLSRPSDMRPEELVALLALYGLQPTRTRGSHCTCSDGLRRLTVPLNVKELKKAYIAEAIKLLGLETDRETQD